jgi:ABC-2 type transport system ATP-binding protein
MNSSTRAMGESMEPVLELKNVTKFYGDFKAVDDVSISLQPGAIYGFLGPNGAGKTTTIRMVLDMIRPSSGSIRVLGKSCALDVRNRIGYLPEEKGLYKKMKAWSVIAYFATLKGMTRKAAKLRAFELLDRYGLKDFAEKKTDALSKGMGQKVQVLASIAHDPDFVILDEPFSGLDPVNQQVMEEIIRGMAQQGRTILFSTHVMQHAERLCERIIVVNRGRKVFDGTIAEAKRCVPRRIAIETADSDPNALALIPGVLSIAPVSPRAGDSAADRQWVLHLHETADSSAILQACFAQGIRLKSFHQSDPTLHDVFVQLVGPEAREASFR